MQKKFSMWSILLSVLGAITFYTSYAIAPVNPEGMIVLILQVLFFTSIIAAVLSILFSLWGFIRKEKGFLKLVGPIVIVFVLLDFYL
ncbi:hypothetical protein H0266_14450 [Halobacillus locisalis]|uniref:Uncharacterized protein n=1 Tax=Halobacillus locisalis TaxID=220753 RepID=A0A838CVY5_9BACI|nr:hypothetical protein [Halobacillus locisalis]MBA2176094.1 hypothetical protein [Halobacillus locisalis]